MNLAMISVDRIDQRFTQMKTSIMPTAKVNIDQPQTSITLTAEMTNRFMSDL